MLERELFVANIAIRGQQTQTWIPTWNSIKFSGTEQPQNWRIFHWTPGQESYLVPRSSDLPGTERIPPLLEAKLTTAGNITGLLVRDILLLSQAVTSPETTQQPQRQVYDCQPE